MNTTSSGSKPPHWDRQAGRPNGAEAEVSSSLPGPDVGAIHPQVIRIILADSEAIFRVGMNKILALEDGLEVVAQTETMPQTMNAVATVPADVVLFEAGLSPTPADAISEVHPGDTARR